MSMFVRTTSGTVCRSHGGTGWSLVWTDGRRRGRVVRTGGVPGTCRSRDVLRSKGEEDDPRTPGNSENFQ